MGNNTAKCPTYDEHMRNNSPTIPDYFMQKRVRDLKNVKAACENGFLLILPSIIKESECPICYIDYQKGDYVFLTKCNHMFHNHCLLAWTEKNRSCPTCRKEL